MHNQSLGRSARFPVGGDGRRPVRRRGPDLGSSSAGLFQRGSTVNRPSTA